MLVHERKRAREMKRVVTHFGGGEAGRRENRSSASWLKVERRKEEGGRRTKFLEGYRFNQRRGIGKSRGWDVVR